MDWARISRKSDRRLEVGSDRNYPCDREIAVKNTVPRGPGPSSAIGVTNITLHVGGTKSVRGVALSQTPSPKV